MSLVVMSMEDATLLTLDNELDALRTLWENLRTKRKVILTDTDRFEVKIAEQEVQNELVRVTAALGETVVLCPCGDVYFEKVGCKTCSPWVPDLTEFEDFDVEVSAFQTTPFDEEMYEDSAMVPILPEPTSTHPNVIDMQTWLSKRRRGW